MKPRRAKCELLDGQARMTIAKVQVQIACENRLVKPLGRQHCPVEKSWLMPTKSGAWAIATPSGNLDSGC